MPASRSSPSPDASAAIALASGLELRLLRYFVAVAEAEHVGRAAARLHISQSPLSRQIRQLEEVLGVQLFERERQRIRITAAGRWLLGEARDMLARAALLVREAHERSDGEAGQIAIGFVGAALSSGVLPHALRRLRAERPQVRIVLRQGSSPDQLAGLRAGELDLALVHRPPRTPELDAQLLLEQPYVLAVPRPGPLTRGPIRARRLDGQPWIIVASGDADRDREPARWDAAWGHLGFTPNVVVRVVDWGSALALVDAGVGHALVPASYAVPPPPNVAVRPVPWLRMTSPLALVRRRSGISQLVDDVAHWLRDAGRAAAAHRRS
jgi:DNA-binding transcriptional LysR family regulator